VLAIRAGDVAEAVLSFGAAHRFEAAAMAIHRMTDGVRPEDPLPGLDEAAEKITRLGRDIVLLCRPRPAEARDVLGVVAEGMKPLRRELATAGADPDAVVAARGRNLATLLLGTFSIHERRGE
jgi:hypothetical protein